MRKHKLCFEMNFNVCADSNGEFEFFCTVIFSFFFDDDDEMLIICMI